jgi:hypothetical protein
MLGKLLVPLLLLSLLLGATAARGDSVAPPPAPAALEETTELEGEEGEEEESAEEECEEAGEEFEEGEISQAELDEYCERQRKRSDARPEECILRSAHGHAAIDEKSQKLKLTIGYTTYEPASAKINIGKGAAHVASLRRQLHRSGIIRVVENLREGLNPRRLILEIRVPSAESAGCPSRRLVLFPD